MERLLDLARAASDQAEVYSLEEREDTVRHVNGKLHDVQGRRRSGVSLRIVRDGRLGLAYTRNLRDPEGLVANAAKSLAGGAEAGYALPLTEGLPTLPTHDPAIRESSAADLVEECRRVHERLAEGTDGEVSVSAGTTESRVRILNSAGTDLAAEHSTYALWASVVYPGSATGFTRHFRARRPEPTPDDVTGEIVRLFNAASREIRPPGGRMKVLFMPNSLIALVWRLSSGTSARSVHEGISPISARVGERVLDGKITIRDHPRDVRHPHARPFDDEGVACDRFPLFTGGVLEGYFADLHYAKKLGVEPTGHGWRAGMWGGDPIALKPAPSLRHLTVEPGEASFDELLGLMDRGIVLEGVLGAHSGNIPNGDYSVGVCPGLYVENGEIVGRVKDAMVAGNVYETLSGVVAVGDRLYPMAGGLSPPILCDGVSVATKGG